MNIIRICMKIVRIFISLWTAVILSQGESLYWEDADPIVNSEFIEAYINKLIETDKYEIRIETISSNKNCNVVCCVLG